MNRSGRTDQRDIPDGLVAFGWYTGGDSMQPRSVNGGIRYSVAHLADAAQTSPGALGPRKPYEAVCGARMKARRGHVDTPSAIERDVAQGLRKWCPRCWTKTPKT